MSARNYDLFRDGRQGNIEIDTYLDPNTSNIIGVKVLLHETPILTYDYWNKLVTLNTRHPTRPELCRTALTKTAINRGLAQAVNHAYARGNRIKSLYLFQEYDNWRLEIQVWNDTQSRYFVNFVDGITIDIKNGKIYK